MRISKPVLLAISPERRADIRIAPAASCVIEWPFQNITHKQDGYAYGSYMVHRQTEPVFHHGPGGSRSVVHPGNREFVRGDRIARPSGSGGGGGGAGDASDSGDGEDEFVFQLTREEFLEFLFDGTDFVHESLEFLPVGESERRSERFPGLRPLTNPLQSLPARTSAGSFGRRFPLGKF